MILIGEKINGSIPSMAKAIAEKNEAHIRDLAKKQADAGASFIDVCASVPETEELDTLKWLFDLVQSVTDVPISIDSPSAKIIAQAIPLCKRPGLINSVSMEGDKVDTIFPLIAESKWECVCLLSDDTGIPKSAADRLRVFGNLMKKAEQYKLSPNRLHIDPLIEMICTSEDGIAKVTETMQKVKAQYPTIHLTGGASNISFNLPMRKFINRAFIILAMNAGMDSAIIDPLNKDMMGLIYAAEALLGQDELCMEYIGAFRDGLFGEGK
ncbi:methyltetrahydrofolate cobalamin methyltransferase [Treponema primitia]|uniref:methyltetrahydrofolate cobalamin methyltransferase n=1 Tax=Treponema primitia TaxID=88058 RepID=UPI0002554D36|nr:methyltetrahydrofolate cobalamin methyltransferase [Treponema primitia]